MRSISRSIFAFFTVAASACGSEPTTPLPRPDGGAAADMSTMPPTTPSYCGAKGKTYLRLPNCTNGCVPDEQVFFLCTEKLGRIAYTRQGLYKTQAYAYSLELDDARACGDTPVKVWTLTPLTGLTNAAVGKTTPSAVDSDACFGYVKQAAYIETNMDRLYYTVAEVAVSQ